MPVGPHSGDNAGGSVGPRVGLGVGPETGLILGELRRGGKELPTDGVAPDLVRQAVLAVAIPAMDKAGLPMTCYTQKLTRAASLAKVAADTPGLDSTVLLAISRELLSLPL